LARIFVANGAEASEGSTLLMVVYRPFALLHGLTPTHAVKATYLFKTKLALSLSVQVSVFERQTLAAMAKFRRLLRFS
jgi:hypothetical protein